MIGMTRRDFGRLALTGAPLLAARSAWIDPDGDLHAQARAPANRFRQSVIASAACNSDCSRSAITISP